MKPAIDPRLQFAALLAGLLVAACDPHAVDGQVLATVEGVEVTRRDLIAEPRKVGDTTEDVLQKIIDRKLLVANAYKQDVDADPDYLAAFRKAREELLVDALKRKMARKLPQPGLKDLLHFAEQRPWMFARRELITLVPSEAPLGEGGEKLIDTAQLDKAYWDILSVPGKPITIDGVPYRIAARSRVPLSPQNDEDQSRALWAEDKIDQQVRSLLEASHARGAVKYGQGMGPGAQPLAGEVRGQK
jgi:hypothetical protein